MNYAHSHRRPRKALAALVLLSLLAFILLFLLLGSPKSSAAGGTKAARANNSQEAPALGFSGPYRRANLVSDLPGVALVEDRLLRNPWGIALKANSPFWVVNNKTDCATLYKGDVSDGPLATNPVLPSVLQTTASKPKSG